MAYGDGLKAMSSATCFSWSAITRTPQPERNSSPAICRWCGVCPSVRVRGQPVEDLIQVGSIGLIKAVDRFDLDRGVELSTYPRRLSWRDKAILRDKAGPSRSASPAGPQYEAQQGHGVAHGGTAQVRP